MSNNKLGFLTDKNPNKITVEAKYRKLSNVYVEVYSEKNNLGSLIADNEISVSTPTVTDKNISFELKLNKVGFGKYSEIYFRISGVKSDMSLDEY
jgi:hypothetical protein